MAAITDALRDGLDGDPDDVIRELYSHYAKALHGYVEQFCPDRASADDIVQETFIRAWRHLPQLSADDRPIRPWLFRVARNLLIDANRAARARPMTVAGHSAGEIGTDSGLEEILDRQLVSAALQQLSPAHQTVLVETFYRGGTMATVARELGIPHGTARSRLHYALDALRKQLQASSRDRLPQPLYDPRHGYHCPGNAAGHHHPGHRGPDGPPGHDTAHPRMLDTGATR